MELRVKGKNLLFRTVDLITFSNMPIRKKFLVFSISVAIWFLLIALIGLLATNNPVYRKVILSATAAALLLLAFFAFWLSRSLIKPIKTMISQLESLTEGDVDLTQKIIITSGDEIGKLSERFNHLLDTIYDMNTFKKVIEEDDTPADIYNRLGSTFTLLGVESFKIYEVSNSRNVMRQMYAAGAASEDTCQRDIMVNSGICRAKKTGDIVSSPHYPEICRHFLMQDNKHHICLPMIIGGSTGGIAQFVFDQKESLEDIQKLIAKAQRYIKEALPVLEAKRLMDTLKESSLKDPMTGFYNRRFLEEYSETLVASTQRRGSTLGLLMCDLDFFKEVNDTFGHNIGDMVLKETANIIRDAVRSSDMLIRFGGEEFLAVLQDVQDGESKALAEKIRKQLEETKIKMPRGFIQKTISIGISEFPKDTANFWQAIKFSDIALYKAKEGGRNLVKRFSRDMWSSEGY